jgi:leucyl/phenylalanyl-tRNA--protein transferase
VPIEPPPTPWVFPTAAELSALPVVASGTPEEEVDESDLVAIGADLAPGTLLAAYRRGLFPMPEGPRAVGWWCPARRGVLELGDLRVSRSLRRSRREFEIRVDTDFDQVIRACADPSRPHGWIDRRIQAAYVELHRLGWAHSVEAWRDGRLEGGLYGVALGGLFAGESMFHRARDASKVALVGLVELLAADPAGAEGRRLIDV